MKDISFRSVRSYFHQLRAYGLEVIPVATFSGKSRERAPGFGRFRLQLHGFAPFRLGLIRIAF